MKPVEETAEPTSVEIEQYIKELKRYIEVLEEDNKDLRAEVQEYRRREMQLVMQRQ